MNSASKPLFLLVILALGLGVLGYWVLDGGAGEPVDEPGVIRPTEADEVVQKAERSTNAISLPDIGREGIEGTGPSTVLWPLEIDLVLKAAGDVPVAPGQASLGAGATARLKGRVGNSGQRGAQAEIRFVAGANLGRVLSTDPEGHFGATDLMPGISIVTITGPGLAGAERELRLRQRRETLLNIGFGRLGTVQGQVLDKQEAPIEGALVHIDGHASYTNNEGFFYQPGLASGVTHILIEKAGFVRHRERINVTANHVTPPDRLKYVLGPGSTLVLSADGNIGGPGPIQVWLSPGSSRQSFGFPFHELNPIELEPGQELELKDLPRELLQVRAFRVGAEVLPEVRNVNLRSSRRMHHRLELRSAEKIVGRVLSDGQPVPGAKIVLEAPNQVEATLRYYRQPAEFMEHGVTMIPPSARQVTSADDQGRFVLSAWGDGSPVRYLSAESPDGSRYGVRLIQDDEREVSLDLEPRGVGAGQLELDTNARYQPLPVVWTMNGEPGPRFELPPSEALRFDGLRVGTWSVVVRWYDKELLNLDAVEVTSAGALESLVLPEGALNGQDREAWIRAGRDFPL